MEDLLENKHVPGTCQSCESALHGRAGKKFCSDQCRAQFNNKRKSIEERWIQQLNRILRKNRSVLKTLNPAGHSTLRQEVLQQMGFDPRFYTHCFQTSKGETYYFCYEWGYQVLQQGKVLIVNWQNYMKPVPTFPFNKQK